MIQLSKLSLAATCITWLAFGGTTVGLAQDDPPGVADVWMIVPKEGHDAQFEEALKQHIAMRVEKGDPRIWQIYVPVTGDELDRYAIRYCCFDWKDQDDYVTWSRSVDTAGHWADNVDQHVENYEHYFSSMDFENSNWPHEDPPPYVGVTDYSIKMGAGPAMQADKVALSTAAKEMNWPYSWAWGSRVGGTATMSLVVRYENYAAMEPPEKDFAAALSEKMGAEAAGKLLQSWMGHFEETSYTIWRHRDDISMKAASD